MVETFNMFYNEVNGRRNMKSGYCRISMLPTTCRDLIVRAAGCGDHFNNPDKGLQDEIMDRTEQSFN